LLTGYRLIGTGNCLSDYSMDILLLAAEDRHALKSSTEDGLVWEVSGE
jgi:hypothetical protein